MGAILLRAPAVALLFCALARGQSCGSIAFSGSSSGITVTPMSFEADFTIECWAKASDFTNDPELFFLNDGLIDVFAPDGFMYGVAIGYAWRHYALSRAGSASRFFIDGALVNTDATAGTLGSPSSALNIGWYQLTSGYGTWQGLVADFRIVNGTALYT